MRQTNRPHATKDSWIGCGSGYRGMPYNLVVTGNYAKAELFINKGHKEENKAIFDDILSRKETIGSSFGDKLDRQRRDDGKSSRVNYWLSDEYIFNEEDLPEMIEFLTSNMIKFEKAIKNVPKDVTKNN